MANTKRIISSAQAINEALKIMGERDKDILLMAEGINDPSSIFGTTKDLVDTYGNERILEMPTSENAICGIAVGAAMSGKKPIVSFHRVEFALLAMEQIINNAAKMYYLSNGKHTAPIIIRLVVGRGWGQGPEHSQSLETLFSYIPGLKVFMPAFPSDYKGMLISAIEDKNPVIIIEHRWTHYIKEIVKEGYYKSDITKPKKIMTGRDCTIVSTSYSSIDAIKAIKLLKKYNFEIDFFDLRVTRPLNLEDIFKSIKTTGAIITVDTGYKTLGIGSEIVAQVTENCFEFLKYKPIRIGLPDHPTPSSRGYIPGFYPDAKKIIMAFSKILNMNKQLETKIINELEEMESKTPIDVPDSSFQGPF